MAQPFGYKGEPVTCLWCGRKLRFRTVTNQAKLDRLREGGVPYWDAHEAAQERAEKAGPYQDDMFDTLTCGYLFGLRAAELGYRLRAANPPS